jgi:hypothetical protein
VIVLIIVGIISLVLSVPILGQVVSLVAGCLVWLVIDLGEGDEEDDELEEVVVPSPPGLASKMVKILGLLLLVVVAIVVVIVVPRFLLGEWFGLSLGWVKVLVGLNLVCLLGPSLVGKIFSTN